MTNSFEDTKKMIRPQPAQPQTSFWLQNELDKLGQRGMQEGFSYRTRRMENYLNQLRRLRRGIPAMKLNLFYSIFVEEEVVAMEEAVKEARRLLHEAEVAPDEQKQARLQKLFDLVFTAEPSLLPDFITRILQFRETPELSLRLWLVEVVEKVCLRFPDRSPSFSFLWPSRRPSARSLILL